MNQQWFILTRPDPWNDLQPLKAAKRSGTYLGRGAPSGGRGPLADLASVRCREGIDFRF